MISVNLVHTPRIRQSSDQRWRVHALQALCSDNSAGENVVHHPFTVYLTEGRRTHQAGTKKHLVCRLQHSLEVGWVSLSERKLLSQVLETHPPGDGSRLSRHLEQTIEPSRNGAAEGLVLRRG